MIWVIGLAIFLLEMGGVRTHLSAVISAVDVRLPSGREFKSRGRSFSFVPYLKFRERYLVRGSLVFHPHIYVLFLRPNVRKP